MAVHFRTLSIKEIRRETSDCVSISFDIPESLKEEFQFKQGQNITIKTIIDDEEIRRSYSICSSPLENELRVAVKKAYNGKFSTHANDKLRKGELLEVLAPTGKFYSELNINNKKKYIAFAAGSGITPVISIIKSTLAAEPHSIFTLVYGNRNRASIIFKEELEAIKNRYMDRFILHHILSREKTDASINYGRINEEKCEELGQKLLDIKNADELFLCGPEEMIFSTRAWLEKKGVDKRKIHFELFGTPKFHTTIYKANGAKKSNDRVVSKVTIKSDGIAFDFDLPFDGEPILDAALKQGADLPFACKGGVCSTCRARLIEGKVEMETNYALVAEEVEAGFILTCQSHPTSERVIVDFDAK
jgi:ring-1,2-phenylacetyl-CoA epoxidase subunit PaaE